MEKTSLIVKKSTRDELKEFAKKHNMSVQYATDIALLMGLERLKSKSEITIPLSKEEEIESRR